MNRSAPLVLLHGAWHRGAAWKSVAALLRDRGYVVHAPDLPGHGDGGIDPRRVTLRDYVDAVLALLDSLDRPAIVVAHSMAGVVLAQCSALRPGRIREAIYVCAFLPRHDESVFDLMALARGDGEALPVESALTMSPDKRTCTIDSALAGELFYQQATPHDARAAVLALQSQPTLPLATRVDLSGDGFGQVPRTYVCCAQDRVIAQEFQRRMVSRQPCQRLLRMDSDHSPTLSAPHLLADLIEASIGE